MSANLRVVMMGTPDFAVPTLRELADAPDIDVVLVVTQPDRPVGRKRELKPSPVKRAALELGLLVKQPEKVSAPEFILELESLRPDVFVTAAYGQILSTKLLAVPRLGCLNVHASLLPRWRGAAPIHRAIMAGDKTTGVTIMKTVRELDAGPVLGMEAVPISSEDNVGTMHDKLSEMGARLLVELLQSYAHGELAPKPQDDDGLTYAHRIVRADEWIRFTKPATEVHNHIRGLSPWPGATAMLESQALKLLLSRFTEGTDSTLAETLPEASSGTVYLAIDGKVFLKCGDGWLELLEVQPAGKRRMSAVDWMRGLRTNQVCLTPVEENE